MPIQLGENEFVKYRNYPNYLVSLENIATITDATNVLHGMGINCRYTNLIIDGGNVDLIL